ARTINVSDDEVAKRYLEYGAVRKQVRQAIAERRMELPPPLEKLAVLVDTEARPPVHHLLRRGLHHTPGAEVQPGVPAALDPQNAFRIVSPPSGTVGTGRRSALARWVASADNPLFARVIVNR